jgi:ribosomal protein S27AE
VTDGGGYARFDYIPYGNYEVSFSIGTREFKVPLSLKEGQGSTLMRVSVAECNECRHLWVEADEEASDQYRCPRCGTWHLGRNGRAYRLKQDEAFCYDFRDGWVWYWRLTCPSCGSAADLEFSSGKWSCPKCGYVEPTHRYPYFRCVLPCGHEHIYSIHYLTDDIPLKCWTCGMEVMLPNHVRSAWNGFTLTIFDAPAKVMVQGEYLARRMGPLAIPILGAAAPIIFGLCVVSVAELSKHHS